MPAGLFDLYFSRSAVILSESAGGVCNALAAALAGTVYDICGSYQPDLLAGMVFVLFSTVCFGLSRQAARQRK